MALKNNSVIRSFATILLALLTALLFRSLVFEPFNIPSGSMKSTLLEGDYILVSKYSYGYSKYSFPFAPALFKGRIFNKIPEAGDVIVFRPAKKSHINYIKRVIGLPGDKVQIKTGSVYINGVKMTYQRKADFIDIDQFGHKLAINQYQETLYNGKSYSILDEIPNSALDNTAVYTVPEGHVFVLGDNRDNSRDSRFLSDIGFVPIENIVGKAYVVVLSFQKNYDKDSWMPFKLRLNRLWTRII